MLAYLGKGTMFVASFRRSAFNWPGNLKHVVIPDMVNETKWFRSPYVGVLSLRVLQRMNVYWLFYFSSLRITRLDSRVPETDVIQSFVVYAKSLICVFHQLVHWQSCIVRFNNSVRYFWRGNNAVCVHNPVWVLLSNLWDEESAHSWASASTKWVGQLESLKAICSLCLFPNNV